jgi:DNA-binding CsgD family transcriptional regulator/predicted nucleic acid-binding protein
MTRITTPSLVGREDVLEVVEGALGLAMAGTGHCIVVEGQPGIGKSRILEAAAHRAAELGVSVAAGTATEFDRAAPLSTLVSALQGSLARDPGVDDLAVVGGNPLWLVNRVRELIEQSVRDQPLLVVVDDAHWADELTALALRILVPALSSSAVLWMLARRTAPARRPAKDAIDWLLAEGAQRMQVEPLAVDAVAAMCADVLRAEPDASVLAEAARAGGNPFLVEELIGTLRDSGQVVVTDGVASIVTSELPETFLDAVDRRLRDLSDDARRLLDAGSVLGRPFSVHEAAGLVGHSAIDLIPAATEAVESGVLVETGAYLAFRHDLLREAVYNALPAPVRLALHREAAAVVQAEGRSPVEVAEHLINGGRVGDEGAVALLRDAVDHVAPTSPGTAADLVLRILDLLAEHDPERPRLTAEAVRLLASSGRVTEAKELGESALRAGLDAASEAALLLGLAEALKHAGDNRAVVQYARRALDRPDVPEPARAQLLAIQAHALLRVDELSAADDSAAAAAELAAATGQHAAMVFGTVVRSSVSRARGELDAAIACAKEAVDVADQVRGDAWHRHPRLWLGASLAAVDRFAEADAVYEMGQREAAELGTAWSLPLWHYYRAELRMAAGRLEDAAAEAEAGIRVAEQLNALAMAVPLQGLLAHVALRRDDLPGARQHLERAERMLDDGISVGPEDLTWHRAVLLDDTGEHDGAYAALADVYERLPDRVLLMTQDRCAAAHLVRIARRAGKPEQAEAAVAAARGLAERNTDVATLTAAAQHAQGLLAGDIELLRQAVAGYRGCPRPLDLATAIEDLATAEEDAGNRKAAVELCSEAVDLYLKSGAKRDAARANQALRGLGVRRGARKGERRSAWGSLTESELRVVKLVAEGLTNRQVASRLFLSPHTVDSHLRHSFTKLGVSSRVELTRHVMANLVDAA